MATQRTLLLLRHAKSDWSTEEPDERRPLSKRGRRDAPAAGRWLAEHAPPLDLVVCSTAIRAQRTWALAGAELDPAPNMVPDERLYAAPAAPLPAPVPTLTSAPG